jgi:hypothetical protein
VNTNIVIWGFILALIFGCCTSTQASQSTIVGETAKNEVQIARNTPDLLPTAIYQQIEQQEPNFPICSQVQAGEITTCIIENSYCSYQPNVKGKPTFCNDAPYPSNNFTYLVWGEDLSALTGHCLIISGKVVLYKGKPEIEAQSNSGFNGYCD